MFTNHTAFPRVTTTTSYHMHAATTLNPAAAAANTELIRAMLTKGRPKLTPIQNTISAGRLWETYLGILRQTLLALHQAEAAAGGNDPRWAVAAENKTWGKLTQWAGDDSGRIMALALQGMLLNEICVAVNPNPDTGDELGYYTAHPQLIDASNQEDASRNALGARPVTVTVKKILDSLIKDGTLYAARLDIVAAQGADELDMRLSLPVKKNRPTPMWVMQPFSNYQQIAAMMRSAIMHPNVAAIRVRVCDYESASGRDIYVSSKPEVLARYNPHADMLRLPQGGSIYLWASHCLYAPQLGAPSTTLALARIPLFRVTEIEPIADASNLPIQPAPQSLTDTINDLDLDNALRATVNDLYNDKRDVKVEGDSGPHAGTRARQRAMISTYLANALGPDANGQLPIIATGGDVMRAYHQLTGEQRARFLDYLGRDMIAAGGYGRSTPLSAYKPIDTTNMSVDDWRNLLVTHVVQIHRLTSKGEAIASMVVTNNRALLNTAYGEETAFTYESRPYKARHILGMIEASDDWGQDCEDKGFPGMEHWLFETIARTPLDDLLAYREKVEPVGVNITVMKDAADAYMRHMKTDPRDILGAAIAASRIYQRDNANLDTHFLFAKYALAAGWVPSTRTRHDNADAVTCRSLYATHEGDYYQSFKPDLVLQAAILAGPQVSD